MKLVREHINEKFKEESDPIEDMNIGMKNQLIKLAKERFHLSDKAISALTDETFLWMAVSANNFKLVKYLIDDKKAKIEEGVLKMAIDGKKDNDIILYLITGGHQHSFDYVKKHMRKK